MTKCDLTHEELVEYYEESVHIGKANSLIWTIVIAAIVIAALSIIGDLAEYGLRAFFVENPASAAYVKFCLSMLDLSVFMLYVYVAYDAFIRIVLNYRDEINEFGERWKAFKLFEKKNKELEGEI